MADTSLLDRLLETLEQLGQNSGETPHPAESTGETPVPRPQPQPAAKPAFADAISRELERERRVTAVRSLRDDPIVQQFRTELADGLIRADTVQQLLGLIDRVVQRVLV